MDSAELARAQQKGAVFCICLVVFVSGSMWSDKTLEERFLPTPYKGHLLLGKAFWERSSLASLGMREESKPSTATPPWNEDTGGVWRALEEPGKASRTDVGEEMKTTTGGNEKYSSINSHKPGVIPHTALAIREFTRRGRSVSGTEYQVQLGDYRTKRGECERDKGGEVRKMKRRLEQRFR